MIIAYLCLTIVLNFCNSLFLLSLFQHSYYSWKRVCYRISDQIKFYPLLFAGLLTAAVATTVIALLFSNFLLLTVLVPLLYLVFTPKILPTKTNRFWRLFSTANIIEISLMLTYYFLWPNYFTFLSFVSLLGPLTAVLAFWVLSPYEIARRNRCYRIARSKLRINPQLVVIGITGSYGKTTVKSFIAQLLSFLPLLTAKGNINTPLGTANFIREELTTIDNYLLVELGIDEIDGMRRFQKYLALDCAVITGLTLQHLRTFKSLANIQKAKEKIALLVKPGGTLIYNADDLQLSDLRSDLTYLPCSRHDYKIIKPNAETTLIAVREEVIRLPFSSENQIFNAYLAFIVSSFISASSLVKINAGALELPSRRKRVYTQKSLTIIDDSYNLNLRGLQESMTKLLSSPGPHYILTGGIKETGGNRELLLAFFTTIAPADTIYFCAPLLPLEKRLIRSVPHLQAKIIRVKKPALPASGTLLILASGDKSSLK